MIKIIDNYYFTADSLQYVLYEKGTRKKIDVKTKKETGEDIEYETVLGYYSSMQSLLTACIQYCNRKKIINGDITTLKECVENLKIISEQVKNISNGF